MSTISRFTKRLIDSHGTLTPFRIFWAKFSALLHEINWLWAQPAVHWSMKTHRQISQAQINRRRAWVEIKTETRVSLRWALSPLQAME